MLAEEEGRWWKGDAKILDAIGNLPPGLRFIPKTHRVDGAAGFISGNVRRGQSSEETHSFLIGLSRSGSGPWRIASEMMMPIPPPTYAPAITADRIIEVLDDAGIRYGVVLSLGYWFGAPTDPITDRHAKTRAENDSTVAQAARYPDRLIPFCGVNPLADYAIAELERCATIPSVRGMKIHLNNSDVELTERAHVEGLREFFRAANRLRVPIVAHIGGPVETLIAEVLPAAPDIPIQIAHMASGWKNARAFADAIAAGRPGTRNLWFDWTQALPIDNGQYSAAAMAGARADAAATMRRLGLGRILFGSDMPLRSNATPREWWKKTILPLPLTDDEVRDIADNIPPYLRGVGA
jgi:predicted TIM-barrel fold metal-dependent hydrolase